MAHPLHPHVIELSATSQSWLRIMGSPCLMMGLVIIAYAARQAG